MAAKQRSKLIATWKAEQTKTIVWTPYDQLYFFSSSGAITRRSASGITSHIQFF